MKILFDQGTPVPLRKFLPGHHVETAYECGWSHLANGELLKTAEEAGFDAILTTDKNLRYQQNLAGRRIAILVLPTTNWPALKDETHGWLAPSKASFRIPAGNWLGEGGVRLSFPRDIGMPVPQFRQFRQGAA